MSARRSVLAGALAVAALAAFGAAPAGAHPLGNFSTNQLVELRFDERAASVHYVLDQAEIPTFQQVKRLDADGDGTLAGSERAALERELIADATSGLELTVDGRPVGLGKAREVELSFPPGQAGLDLTRLEASFAAAIPAGAARVEVANEAFDGRVGWRAIRPLPGEGTAVVSSVPAEDPTDGLRAYPSELLESPLDQRSASFEVSPGAGTVSAPDGISGGEPTADRAGDGFASTLASGDTHGLLILVLLATAFGWGALHALSPGHGKAMVAGYLAGSRATPRHAFALGATVTATHTASVFALGAITLAASEFIVPERLYPWLGVVSGLMVVAVGLAVIRSRFRRWRAARAGAGPGHEHDPGHHHHHHDHDGHGHHHHAHDGHHHHHHHHGDAPIRMRELFGLGVSGGLVPCPSALVVLIAAISQHRIALGLALILAFSVGLAAVVSGVGLLTLYGRRLLGRLQVERRVFGGRLTGALPALSASLIVAVGLLITSRAIPELG